MYQEMQAVSDILQELENGPLAQGKFLKLQQAFALTASSIDKAASASKNMQDSVSLAKLHQGMLACQRLMQSIQENVSKKI